MEIDWSQTKKTQAGIWWREAVNEEDEIFTRIKTIEKDLERSRLMWRKQKTVLRTKIGGMTSSLRSIHHLRQFQEALFICLIHAILWLPGHENWTRLLTRCWLYLVQPLIWSRLAKRNCQWMRQAYSAQLRRTQPRNFQKLLVRSLLCKFLSWW